MAFKIVQTPAVALYSGMSSVATTMKITPVPVDLDGTALVMSDFGTTGYCTVDPKILNYEEIISFTGLTNNGDNTVTLTGLTRDLISKSPYNTSGTGKVHGSSAVVVFSDNPQVYNQFAVLSNDNTWTGKNTFNAPIYYANTSVTSSATPTPNIDTTTFYNITALAANATFGAPTGTPINNQALVIRIKSDSSIRTLTWNAAYIARGVTLPSATVASKYLRVMFLYNSTESTWDCVSSLQEV